MVIGVSREEWGFERKKEKERREKREREEQTSIQLRVSGFDESSNQSNSSTIVTFSKIHEYYVKIHL
jgi:hypothetical protein